MIGECSWASWIYWSETEADAIVDHAPNVARQLIAHNEKFERWCE